MQSQVSNPAKFIVLNYIYKIYENIFMFVSELFKCYCAKRQHSTLGSIDDALVS